MQKILRSLVDGEFSIHTYSFPKTLDKVVIKLENWGSEATETSLFGLCNDVDIMHLKKIESQSKTFRLPILKMSGKSEQFDCRAKF